MLYAADPTISDAFAKALSITIVLLGEIIREGDKKHKLQKLQKSIVDDIINAVDGFEPGVKTRSTKWENWLAELDLYTCIECRRLHGKILGEDEFIPVRPPLHDRCRYRVEPLCAVFPGYATRNGLDGADYWLKYFGKLYKEENHVRHKKLHS